MPDTCFFSYDGAEHTTLNFVFCKINNFSDEPDDKPQGMIGDKPFWCAITNSDRGKIFGKVDKDGNCTFAHHGENTTKDFQYVHGPCEKDTSQMKYEMPQPQGSQNDVYSLQWCGVANTEWGLIPGKVHVTLGRDNICFVHDGKGKYSKDYKVIKS